MNRFSSLLCSLLFCMITYAQEITVTGKVTAGGEEMPGVTVAVKGQTRGTITSIDGSYQIQVNGRALHQAIALYNCLYRAYSAPSLTFEKQAAPKNKV